ncbi:DUF3089 domain-containing protein [Leptospira yasudae]|uniref:DUF3089 domain-containing protein n=1 Tax=Leptospira yasudae TaxID=2202201 RepID=UPI000E59CE4C|nr:DUF3089 domain-containing protein [Leptospira yasudae]RHX95590.1 DUF3089 domain-containing protein [Leptospira yasudae]
MTRILLRSSVILCLPFFLSCLWLIRPSGNFEEHDPPEKPDYSLFSSWAALPQTDDDADRVPSESNLKDEQSNAPVDVFFIHPTTFYGREWNAKLENERVNRRTDEGTIQKQASVFNCCAKIYAPRYRQATLYSFLDPDNGKRSLELAYQDILTSFDYYLKQWNGGRPFIIASHSQGTHHAIRLLKDRIDGTVLSQKFVAAYLVGGAVPIDSYRTIPTCKTSSQTGCFVSWRTFGEDAEIPKLPHDPKGETVCINPISWKEDEILAEAGQHPGGVNAEFKTIERQLCSARCSKGILRISKPNAPGFSRWIGENYHIFDYGIFYQSIRDNVSKRIQTFLEEKKN